MLQAGLAACGWALWDRLEVHALELVGWALQGAGEEVLPVLQQLAWQAEQLLQARLPRSTWLGGWPQPWPPPLLLLLYCPAVQPARHLSDGVQHPRGCNSQP